LFSPPAFILDLVVAVEANSYDHVITFHHRKNAAYLGDDSESVK